MSLSYKSHVVLPIFGTKTVAGVPTSVALTSAYTGNNKAISTGGMSKLNLDILYTMGATETTNSIEVQIECSNDGVNYFRIPNESASGGVSTLTAREFTFVGTNAAAATISIGIDIFYKFMKISIKESGVVTNAGTVFAEATLSGK